MVESTHIFKLLSFIRIASGLCLYLVVTNVIGYAIMDLKSRPGGD